MQNTKQVLDGDNQSIFKRNREFYLDEDLVDKIDSIEYGAQVNKIEEIEVNGVPVEPDESKTVKLKIPRVIDTLTSDSSTDALSARMGNYLYSLYQQTGTVYRYRGSVATFNDLPESGNLQGDVYNILDTDMNYAWTGTEWDALGGTADLSNYLAKNNTIAFTPTGNYNPATKKYVDDAVAGITPGQTYTAGNGINIDANNEISVDTSTVATQTDLNSKQETLIAGSNIQIAQDGKTISSTDTTYTAGTGINIDSNNVISSTVTPGQTYTAGTGINIDANNAITNTGVLSVNGEDGNVTIPEPTVKTFTFANSSDNATAEEIYRWVQAGNTALAVLDGYIYCSASLNGGYLELTSYNPTPGTSTNTIKRLVIASDYDFWLESVPFLVTDYNYQTPYTPTYNGSPATKKYVDDSVSEVISSGTTAPSNPTEGQLWYDTTNDVLKVYDGTNWNVVGDDAANINTKTFYLSSISDYTTGREIYEWLYDDMSVTPTGNGAIVILNNEEYYLCALNFGYAKFKKIILNKNYGNSESSIEETLLDIETDGGVVDSIYLTTTTGKYLDTDKNYSTPYTPTYDGSPATKKYVDDNIKTYNAGDGINIGNITKNGRQGPCPDGFHVPASTEWTAICNILTSTFGLTGNRVTVETYLKMPFAYARSWQDGSVLTYEGDYWSSTPTSDDGNAFCLHFGSNYLQPTDNSRRAFGFPIRAFKDTSVTPDNTWTTLYDGSSVATGAGIFHNSTLGLISISGDGINWTTIADKNLGATTVWNSGDTLSEANCGGFFQRGNNYMFTRTGSVTTSSTQVDASSYGPRTSNGYYSSSTFITGSYNWSNPKNDDLWGNTTGIYTVNDAIINTGVLSVNGQTGNVQIGGGLGTPVLLGTISSGQYGSTVDLSGYNWFAIVMNATNVGYSGEIHYIYKDWFNLNSSSLSTYNIFVFQKHNTARDLYCYYRGTNLSSMTFQTDDGTVYVYGLS